MSFKRYLTRKLSHQKFRLTNILPVARLSDRKRFTQSFRHSKLYRTDQLPPKVDLRPDMTPVENQLNIGSSVANCLAGAYEYLVKRSNGCSIDVSRLFIYYNARMKGSNSGIIIDSGCSITGAIEALEEFGTCLDSLWPYDILFVNIQPDDAAYEQAENHKINKVSQINLDLNEMKSCLAHGFPFAFGLQLYKSFDNAAQNGIVSIPNKCVQDKLSNGSHALLAVGYSDRSNAFIVRNSWGEDWGDQGYCYIPYDYMTNPNLCFDMWTIRKVLNEDFGREYWHFDDIVNYLNDEDYLTDDDIQISWRDYYNRKNVTDDNWSEYRNYLVAKDSPSRYDDNYFNDRYRRERYDRDNEPYAQQTGGYVNNGFSSSRNCSASLFDRYQDEDNYYRNSDYHRFANNHQGFMF